ncbi:nitroreductase family protein [Streptosporangium saharense]|uniref:Nitroreductase n=1 Tax=Streptosporangium saharense TaxID=1706840 RepID=A0A7W7QVL6_9ACTN|nr:nitroreductase family protein [Streptosporangium saharense]MBB4920582.1 nitroreductase [Streptosporangium saharense]
MSVRPDLTCDELLTTTRAVRRGLDDTRPVDLELVKECLRLALQAPNGSNGQRWRWIVLTDPDVRAGIADVYRRAFLERSASLLARLDELDPRTRRMAIDGRDLAERLHRIPVLVVPCLELADERLPEGNQAGLWASLLPAMWSYALAARSRGLATTWTSVHLDREREAAELLGLPPNVRQGGLLPTAHGLKTVYKPGPRLPLEEVLHIDGWKGRRS